MSESPVGPFQFYDHVHYPDGTLLGAKEGDAFQYDPGIFVDDNGRVYLVSGFCPIPGINPKFAAMHLFTKGCQLIELADDMCTVREAPQIVLPQQADAEETEFAEHPFFEAPSLRKANGRYYLIYSSTQNHELCYAVADKPQGVYHYGGTIVSNGDIGLDGRTVPCNYTGTNHGSIVEINGQWYVFYHRQTNRTPYSRQGCAEKITLLPDGSIPQVRVTSCGLNDGPLKIGYSYPAGIACCLQTANGAGPYRAKTTIGEEHPYITQDGPDGDIFAQQYVANLRDGSNAGYRSFLLHPGTNLTVTYRCTGDGTLEIAAKESGASALVFPVTASNTWQTAMGTLQLDGEQELWFTYRGTGALDLRGFKL